MDFVLLFLLFPTILRLKLLQSLASLEIADLETKGLILSLQRITKRLIRLGDIQHGVQRRMISVDNFFEFLRLLFFAVLLLYET